MESVSLGLSACTHHLRERPTRWPNQTSSMANLLLVDQVSYQSQTLRKHASSYGNFNWRTN